MHPMLNIAVRAARKAGDLIVRHLDRLHTLTIDTKGDNDYVSEVDRLAEQAIIEIIHKAYPKHAILAEERGSHGSSEYEWVIDPLDGTLNFLHGYPQFGVSIALKHYQQLDQAVIYDPIRQELFTASRGGGAQVNNRRMRVSNISDINKALLATGFPARRKEQLDHFLRDFKTLFLKSSGIRRAGAACLDLAHVASGRLDGFWEAGLGPWDIAAGALLIQEAGGMVSDFDGTDGYLSSGDIVAGNPKIFSEILHTLQASRKQP